MNNKTIITILIVEDEPIISLDESRIIQSYGYNVICAKNGEGAIKLANENNDIRLILMDLDLGKGIDGAETSRRILLYKKLPIIFLSFCSESDYNEKTKDILNYGHVMKNFDTAELKYTIKNALCMFYNNK